MNPDIQRANMWKRISAAFLDLILLVILITGIALLLSQIVNYNSYVTALNDGYAKYEEMYDVEFGLDQDAFDALSKEEQDRYMEASNAMDQDEEVIYAYDMTINLSFLIISVSIFLGYLILEFFVPMLFGNGQTIGKKMFSLALMRTDSVKLTNFALFVRSMLGKCTIETMVPAMLFMAMLVAPIGMIAPTIILGLLAVQIGLLVSSRNRACIHDLMAVTVVIDHSSQMIFETADDLMEHKKQLAAEEAQRQDY
ncbi:MAG: RDD family protein [Oscillospiraceae bacterium]|nr:RDD family protein [Oscillospiraceae bacterium]